MKVTLVAAIGERNELGLDGDLIWRMPGDLAHAKELTMGHPVIMGRKTYDSIPEAYRPLAGRTNIVLSRKDVSDAAVHEDVHEAQSVREALSIAAQSEGANECFVFGGAEVYRLLLPYADALELTMIEARAPDADTYFPQWDRSDFHEKTRESFPRHDPVYHFVRYEKK